MKSRTLCGCVIALLLISTVAFGEIVEIGDWDGDNSLGDWTYTSATAHATGTNQSDYSWGDGWQYTYTTVYEDSLDWYTYVYVWAEVKMWLWNDEACRGDAIADADAYNPYGYDHDFASVMREESGDYGYTRKIDGIYDTWSIDSDQFYAYEGVTCSHFAIAYASVPEDGDSIVHSHADSVALGSLDEP